MGGFSPNRWMDGTVKSWNDTKGFGFVTCNQLEGDIFISRKLCPLLTAVPVQQGMVFRIKAVENKDKPGMWEANDLEMKTGGGGNNGGLNVGMQTQMQMQMPILQQMVQQMVQQTLAGMAGNAGLGNVGSGGSAMKRRGALSGATNVLAGNTSPLIGKKLTGVVNFFYEKKGYGFLVCDQVPKDIFVSEKTSPGFNQIMIYSEFDTPTSSG